MRKRILFILVALAVILSASACIDPLGPKQNQRADAGWFGC